MKKKLLCIFLAAAMIMSTAFLAAGCGGKPDPDDDPSTEEPGGEEPGGEEPGGEEPGGEEPGGGEEPATNLPTQELSLDTMPFMAQASNASVHDPSVFQDPADGTYYVFGSHFAVASSTNLVDWTSEVADKGWSSLYGAAAYTYNGVQWPYALKDTVDLVKPSGIDTTWAPDVEYYNGKYYMYYSLTKAFGSPNSAIGRVEADSVMGPYSNNKILVESMNRSSGDPNCIDPELFYDKEGKLWMVYGSFSGGIFIKELYNEGENWGLPKEDGFGKCIWLGAGSGPEGPFVFYNEVFDYYYLMVSYGNLNDDYNMRIARSKNPDGPYVDMTDADMATVTNKGEKLEGNYIIGGYTPGMAAVGHNSVIEVNGEFFSVAHARSGSGDSVSAGHSLFVQQIFFNEDGWPVLNPNRYTYEIKSLVTQEQAAGTYDVLLHTEGTTKTYAESVEYTFAADGTITDASGAEKGSWVVKEDYYVEITLDGVLYKGVICPGWRMYDPTNEQCAVLSFTTVSEAGRALWAVGQVDPLA